MYMSYSKNPNLPKVRMKAVLLVRKGWSIRRAARYFGFSHGALINWLKKAPSDGRFTIPTLSSAPKSHPNELPNEKVDAIVKQRKEHNRCAKIVHHELVNKGISVSLSSVERTLKRKGLIRKRGHLKRWHFSEERPLAVFAGDLVQIDTIHFVINERRFYVYTLVDVKSRWAYAKVVSRINTRNSLLFVKEALQHSGFEFKMIQSDHGSEFSVWFTENLGKLGVLHRHIRVRKNNDNGHIERFNRTLQEECLNKVDQNPKSFQQAINEYMPYYNGQRLHLGINYLTPLQVVTRC
jgi:transposase InsO family protein